MDFIYIWASAKVWLVTLEIIPAHMSNYLDDSIYVFEESFLTWYTHVEYQMNGLLTSGLV